MKIYWTRNALNDIARHRRYIARDKPGVAKKVALTIRTFTIQQLETPREAMPGRVEGTYELVIPRLPYTVVYRRVGDDVNILRVCHQSQLWPKKF